MSENNNFMNDFVYDDTKVGGGGGFFDFWGGGGDPKPLCEQIGDHLNSKDPKPEKNMDTLKLIFERISSEESKVPKKEINHDFLNWIIDNFTGINFRYLLNNLSLFCYDWGFSRWFNLNSNSFKLIVDKFKNDGLDYKDLLSKLSYFERVSKAQCLEYLFDNFENVTYKDLIDNLSSFGDAGLGSFKFIVDKFKDNTPNYKDLSDKLDLFIEPNEKKLKTSILECIIDNIDKFQGDGFGAKYWLEKLDLFDNFKLDPFKKVVDNFNSMFSGFSYKNLLDKILLAKDDSNRCLEYVIDKFQDVDLAYLISVLAKSKYKLGTNLFKKMFGKEDNALSLLDKMGNAGLEVPDDFFDVIVPIYFNNINSDDELKNIIERICKLRKPLFKTDITRIKNEFGLNNSEKVVKLLGILSELKANANSEAIEQIINDIGDTIPKKDLLEKILCFEIDSSGFEVLLLKFADILDGETFNSILRSFINTDKIVNDKIFKLMSKFCSDKLGYENGGLEFLFKFSINGPNDEKKHLNFRVGVFESLFSDGSGIVLNEDSFKLILGSLVDRNIEISSTLFKNLSKFCSDKLGYEDSGIKFLFKFGIDGPNDEKKHLNFGKDVLNGLILEKKHLESSSLVDYIFKNGEFLANYFVEERYAELLSLMNECEQKKELNCSFNTIAEKVFDISNFENFSIASFANDKRAEVMKIFNSVMAVVKPVTVRQIVKIVGKAKMDGFQDVVFCILPMFLSTNEMELNFSSIADLAKSALKVLVFDKVEASDDLKKINEEFMKAILNKFLPGFTPLGADAEEFSYTDYLKNLVNDIAEMLKAYDAFIDTKNNDIADQNKKLDKLKISFKLKPEFSLETNLRDHLGQLVHHAMKYFTDDVRKKNYGLDFIKGMAKALVSPDRFPDGLSYKILPEVFDDLKIKEGDTEEIKKQKQDNFKKILGTLSKFIDAAIGTPEDLKNLVSWIFLEDKNDKFSNHLNDIGKLLGDAVAKLLSGDDDSNKENLDAIRIITKQLIRKALSVVEAFDNLKIKDEDTKEQKESKEASLKKLYSVFDDLIDGEMENTNDSKKTIGLLFPKDKAELDNPQNKNDNFMGCWSSNLIDKLKLFINDFLRDGNLSDENITNLESLLKDGIVLAKEFLSNEKKEENNNGVTENKSIKMLGGIKNIFVTVDKFVSESNFDLYKNLIAGCLFDNKKLAEAVLDKINSEINKAEPNFDLIKSKFNEFETLCGSDILSGYNDLTTLKDNINSYCDNKNIAADTRNQTLNYLSEIKNYIADKMKVGTKENKNVLTSVLNKIENQNGILKFVKPELFQQANDILFKYFDGAKNKNEINGIFNGVIDGCMDLLNATKKVKVKNTNDEEEEKVVVDQKKMIVSLEKLLGVVNNISKENQSGFKKFLMCGIDILKDIINDESPEGILSSAVEKIDFLKPKDDNSDKANKDALKNNLKSKIKPLGSNLVSILSESIKSAGVSAGAVGENKLITLINNGFAAYKKLMSGMDSKDQKEIIASVQSAIKLVSDIASSAPENFEHLLKDSLDIVDYLVDDASIFDSMIEKFGPKERIGENVNPDAEKKRVNDLKNEIKSSIKTVAKKMTKLLSSHVDKEKDKSSGLFYDLLDIYREILEATKKNKDGKEETDPKVIISAIKKIFDKINDLIDDNLSDLKEILKGLAIVFSKSQIFDSLLANVGFLTDDLKSKIKESIPKIATAFSNRIDKIQNKSDLKELFEGVINEYENLLANKNNDKKENDVAIKVNFIGTVKIIAGLLKKVFGDELENLLDDLIKDVIKNQEMLNSVIDIVNSQEECIKYIKLFIEALPTIAKLLFDYVGNAEEKEIKELTNNFISIAKKISEAFKQTIDKDIIGDEFENAKKELNNGIDELLGLADLLTKNNLHSLKLVLTNLLKSNKLPGFIAEESGFTENDIKSVFENALPLVFDLLSNHINKMNSKDKIKDVLNNALNKVIDLIRVFSTGGQVEIVDALKDMLGLVDSFAEENNNDLVELRKLFKAILKDGEILRYAVDLVEFLKKEPKPIDKVLKDTFTLLANVMLSSFDNAVTKKDLVDLLKELLDKYRLFAAEISKPLDIKKIKDIVNNDFAIDEIMKKFDFNQDLKEKFSAFIDTTKNNKATEKDIFDSYYTFNDELEKTKDETGNNCGLSKQNHEVLEDVRNVFANAEIDQKNIISITKEISDVLYDKLIGDDSDSTKNYKDIITNLLSDGAALFNFFILNLNAKKIKGLQEPLIKSLPYLTKVFVAYINKPGRTSKEIKKVLDDIFNKYLGFLEAIYDNSSEAKYQENIINSLRHMLKLIYGIAVDENSDEEEILTYCKDFFDKLLEGADIFEFTISNVESINEIAPVLNNASKPATDIFLGYIKTKCKSIKDIFDITNKVFDTYLDFANSISSDNENAYEYQKEIIDKVKAILNLLDELSGSLSKYKNLFKELLYKALIFIFSVSKVEAIKEIAPVLNNTLPYLTELISKKIDKAGTIAEIKNMLVNLMDKYLKLAGAISSTEPAAKYQDDIINALTEILDILDQNLVYDNDLESLELYKNVIINLLGEAKIFTFLTDKNDSLKSIQPVFEKALPCFTRLLSKRIKNTKSKGELTKLLKDLFEKYKSFSDSIVKDLDIKNVKEKLSLLNKSFVISDNDDGGLKELKAALNDLENKLNKVEPDQKAIFIAFNEIDNLVKNKKSSDGKDINLPENFSGVYEQLKLEFVKTEIDQFQAIDKFYSFLKFISKELVYENKDQDNNVTDGNYEDFVEFVNNFLGDGEVFKFIIDNDDKDKKTLKQNLVVFLNNICPKIAEAIRVNCKSKITNKKDVENFSGLIGNLFSIYKQTIGIFKAIKKDVSGKVIIQSSIDSFSNKEDVLKNTQKILVEIISKFENFVGYFFKLGLDAYANLNKDVDQKKIKRCNELVESISSDISDVVKSCIESEKFLSNDGPVSKLLDSIISVDKNKDDQNSKSDENFLDSFTSLVDLFSGNFSLKIVIEKIKAFYRGFKNLFTDKTMFNKVIVIFKKFVSNLREEDLDWFFGKTNSFNIYWRKWLLIKLKRYVTESKTNDVLEEFLSNIDFSSKFRSYNSPINLIERILIVRVKDKKDATKLEIFFLDLAYYLKKALFKFIRVIIFLLTYIPYLVVAKSCDGVKGLKNSFAKIKERFRELGMFDWLVKEIESLKKSEAKGVKALLKIIEIITLSPIFIIKYVATEVGKYVKNASKKAFSCLGSMFRTFFKKIKMTVKGNKDQDKVKVDKDKNEIKQTEKDSDVKQQETEKDKIESQKYKDNEKQIEDNDSSTDVSEDENAKSGVFDKLKDNGPKGKNDNTDKKDNRTEIDAK